MKRQTFLVAMLLFPMTTTAYAIDFKYTSISDFSPLSKFESVEAFEKNYQEYVQTCLDNTSGGTAGIPCLIGYEMWDRELNTYYKELYSKLDKTGKNTLKESQQAWLKERDLSIKVNSMLLDQEYTQQGTMYQLMRASDSDQLMTPIVKERVLVLRRWLEFHK